MDFDPASTSEVLHSLLGCTPRRFLHQHLAQIKHILPEAVHLEYFRSWDSDLQRSKWDLSISLLPMPSPAEKEEEESEFRSSELISSVRKQPKISSVERRKAFHRRLLEFANTHPEVTQMHLRRERERQRERV
jgi:hypothetical protein